MNFTRKLRPGYVASAAFAIVIVVNLPRARATEVATRLEYSAAPGCPGVDDFAAAVAGRLGYRPFRKDASERVVIRIEPDGKALEGHIEWRDAGGGSIGDQTLPSRTGNCPELVRAMGFAVAVQFQLMTTLGAGPRVEPSPPAPARAQPQAPTPRAVVPPAPSTSLPSGASSTPAEPLASVTPTPPSPPSPPTAVIPPAPAEHLPATVVARDAPAPSPIRTAPIPSLTVGAGASVAFAAAPSVVPLGRLFAAAGWPHVVVELAGEISPRATTPRQDGTGFTHRQVLGSLAGCGVLRSWGACLVAKVGELRVEGQGVDVPTPATGLIMQMGARLTWTHIFGGRFELSGHADGLVLATEGVVTLDSIPVWTTPRFTASLGIDVGVRFR